MDIVYQYIKQRGTYGQQPLFCEAGPEMCDSIPVEPNEHKRYILRNPVHTATQNTPTFWWNEINTFRADYTNTGVNHAEGGWPKDIVINDPEVTQRYRRKVEKDDGYIHCVMSTYPGLEGLILQNNAIDMYETYFNTMPELPSLETNSCRTMNVFRDAAGNRPINSICWRPDGAPYFAVSYLDVDHSRIIKGSRDAYIWDIENPNYPETTLTPPHGLVDLQYNARNTSLLAGALLNGQVAVWDRRSNDPNPFRICPPHVAHRDLARNVRFINAKSGMEFFSSSADGVCKWWDIRDMSEPTEEMIIDWVPFPQDSMTMARAYAVCSLEFEPTIPTRFMVGTENGYVISGNRKGKTPTEKLSARYEAHSGPVWKIERNPASLKNFLTVGDFTVKIWSDECRESAVLWSPPQRHKILDGAWSPTRLSLLLLAQGNGMISIWDILRRQYEPVLTMQLCNEPLQRISVHAEGSLVACGSAKGNVLIVELSSSLSKSGDKDKGLLGVMFEREAKRERILEARMREIKLKQRAAEEGDAAPSAVVDEAMEAAIGDKDLAFAASEYFQITKKELSLM